MRIIILLDKTRITLLVVMHSIAPMKLWSSDCGLLSMDCYSCRREVVEWIARQCW